VQLPLHRAVPEQPRGEESSARSGRQELDRLQVSADPVLGYAPLHSHPNQLMSVYCLQ
jgi:hypothetical protein